MEWPAFFGLILLAWGAVWAMQPAGGAYGQYLAMWLLMAAAMMAPSFAPTLATYRDLARAGAASGPGGFHGLLAGYLAIWAGFAALAALAQAALARAGLPGGANWLSPALLALAGAYQFSALKRACLSKCRAPLSWFMGNWRDGALGGLGMGLRQGVLCLGCCWALMALGFVGGAMNPVWMGIATLLMVLEKLPAAGRWLSAPLGVALLAAAVYAALAAFTN